MGSHAATPLLWTPRFNGLRSMLIKLAILALLAAIIVALIFGGVYLVKDPSTSRRTARALSWRVGLQVALILLLILAFFMGWIRPHGVGG